MIITDEVKQITRQARQNHAVAAYLEKHGSISNYTAIFDGLPNIGRITRLAARVKDLRDAGYEIKTDRTETEGTVYRIIAKPGVKQLSFCV